MNGSVETPNSLSLQSPISLLRGIGDKRAKALAELGIYSVQDFLKYTETEDGALRIAGKIGMKTENVLQLRSKIETELQRTHLPSKTKWYRKRSSIYILLAIVNILIVLAGVFIEATSFYHYHHPSYAVTALFDRLDSTLDSNYILRVSSRYDAINVKTKVQLVSRYDLCFGNDELSTIPRGVFFSWLTDSKLRQANASIYVVEQQTKKVEEGWVTLEEVAESAFPLPITIQDVSHLENYPGVNLIVWIDTAMLDEVKSMARLVQHYECRFKLEVDFVDDVGAIFLDPYRKGNVSVLPFISYTEAKYIGIEDLPDDGFGPILGLEMRDTSIEEYGIYEVEYFWEPTIDGEFIQPDNLLGARRFYEIEHGNPIETRFSLKTEGAQWIPFIAGIIGLQMLIGASQFLISKFRRRG